MTYGAGGNALNPLFAPGTGLSLATTTTSASTRFNGHIVRAGVNYHFNFGGAGPVVAKY